MVVRINHLDGGFANNGDGRAATGLVIMATLPVLFEAALPVPVITDPIDGQDRAGFVL